MESIFLGGRVFIVNLHIYYDQNRFVTFEILV